MKKPYSAVERPQTWLQLILAWALLLLPGLGFAQTFTEAMGNSATEGQTVDQYEANLGFDNDNEKGFAYQALATPQPTLSVANPSTGSAGPNILFAPATTGNPSFTISNISTAGFSSASLTFLLNAPAGAFGGTGVAATNQRFRVQIGIGSVSNTGVVTYTYTNYGYTYSAGSAGGWGLATVSLPAGFVGNPYVAIRFLRFNATANASGDYRIDDVTLTGSTTGVVTAAPNSLDFGDVAVGANSTPQVIRVGGQDLTGNVTLTAPAGYQIRVFQTGGYVQSLTLAANNGVVPSTRIQVRFTPAAAGVNSGTLTVTSPGVPQAEVDLTGNGTVPTLTAAPSSYDFGTVFVGQISAAQNITVSGTNVISNVTVTAPTGFVVRRTASDAFAQSITLTAAEANAGFTFQAAFQPTTAGSYSSAINITTPNAATSVAVTGQANPVPSGPYIQVNPSSLDFGTVSATGSAQTLSFVVSAGNLTAPVVLTGSNNNIVFRDASAGGSFVNGPITITPNASGTISNRTIEVQLTGPIAVGPFNGTITASSTGATNQVVTITANSTGNNSVINATGTLNQFSTVPGVASAVQSYQLSGTNLLQDITVTAPQYFQVSLDPTFAGVAGTGNTITVARNASGDVPQQAVYVRFLPPSALSTTSLILNSSSPAVAQGIQVAGTSEPSIQIQNPFVEVRNVVINTTSSSQALNISAQRVLSPITITKQVSSNPLNPGNTPQFQLSTDNVNFSNSITLTPNATTYTISQPIYVRYAPTYLGSAQSTLQFQSADFAVKSAQNFDNNGLLAGRSIDTEPTQRSTANVVRNNTTATVTFNLPANYAQLGYGEGRLIVASENPNLPAANQPADGTSYQTGNQTYGQGPQIAPGFYAVYAGANQTVTIDGLDIRKTYYFYTFEFNNIDNNFNVAVSGAENYLSPPVPNTIPGIIAPSPLPVTLVSFSAKVKGNQVALNWVTASELNNKQFEVQRSRDGRTFETILVKEGKGTTSAASTYNEFDNNPVNGLSYYRLKQVDLDGTSSLSSTVTVNFLGSGSVSMYPNPVQDLLTIDLGGSAAGVTAIITDMTGRVISTQQVGGNSKLDMTNLKAGTYLVTVGTGDAKITRRITKQ